MQKNGGITVDYMGSSNARVADQVSVINQAISSGVVLSVFQL